MANVLNPNRRHLIAGAATVTALHAAGVAPLVTAAQAKSGQTLTWLLVPEPPHLFAAVNSAYMVQAISAKMLEGLLTYDQTLKSYPQLATSWNVAPDGKKITFKLRPGVKWHDGAPFTSADVKFSFEEILRKFHPRGRSTFANLTAVETPDPLTAVFVLSTPSPYIMQALSSSESPIVPKHLLEGKDPLKNSFLSAPVGTGPFKFVEWQRGNYVAMKRNAEYWEKGKPHIETLIVRFIADDGGRAAALEAGEVHLAGSFPVALEDIQRLGKLPNLAVTTKGSALLGGMFYLELNVRDPIMKDVRVRQAIAHAIDREFVRKTVFLGYADVATSPFPPTLTTFHSKNLPGYAFDLKRAEALLDAAGYKRGANGVRFKMVHADAPYTERYKRFGTYLKQALAPIGIEVELRADDTSTWMRKVWTDNAYQSQAYGLYTMTDPTIGVQRFYWSKNIKKGVVFSNGSGYASPEMDAIIEAAQVAVDPAERKALFHKMQVKAMTDLPIIPIVTENYVAIYNKRLKGFEAEKEGIFGNFADFRIEAAG